MSITKTTIIAYLLDRLNQQTRTQVEQAIHESDELHAFYCDALKRFNTIESYSGTTESHEDEFDEPELSDFDRKLVNRSLLERKMSKTREAVRAKLIKTVEERIEDKKPLVLDAYPAGYVTDSYSAAAKDVAPVEGKENSEDLKGASSDKGTQEPTMDSRLEWKILPDAENEIYVELISHSNRFHKHDSLAANFTIRFEPEPNSRPQLIEIENVKLKRMESKDASWEVILRLEGRMNVNEANIKRVKGEIFGDV